MVLPGLVLPMVPGLVDRAPSRRSTFNTVALCQATARLTFSASAAATVSAAVEQTRVNTGVRQVLPPPRLLLTKAWKASFRMIMSLPPSETAAVDASNMGALHTLSSEQVSHHVSRGTQKPLVTAFRLLQPALHGSSTLLSSKQHTVASDVWLVLDPLKRTFLYMVTFSTLSDSLDSHEGVSPHQGTCPVVQ
jgi:hypothetical protein